MLRFCISGSNGFNGSHFYKEFSDKVKIYKISLNNSSSNFFDLRNKKDKKKLEEFIKKKQIDYLIHFGWGNIANPFSKKHISNNFYNFKELIKICQKLNLKKFISIGSIDEYAKLKNIHEKSNQVDIKKNKNLYAKSKILSNFFLKKNYSKPYLHLRIPNVYGLKKNNLFLINKILINVFKKKKIKLHNLNQQRIYIFVNDLVKYIYKLTLNKKYTGVLNIGKGSSISIYEYIELYLRQLKKLNVQFNIKINGKKQLKRFTFKSNFYRFPDFKNNLSQNLFNILNDQIKSFKLQSSLK